MGAPIAVRDRFQRPLPPPSPPPPLRERGWREIAPSTAVLVPGPVDPGIEGGRPGTEREPIPQLQSRGGPPLRPSHSRRAPLVRVGLVSPTGGGKPPPGPPLPSSTISHLGAPLMLRFACASPSDRQSSFGTASLVSRSVPPLLLPSSLLPRLPRGFGGGVAAPSHPGRFVDQRITLFSWQGCHARHRGA